MNLNTIELPVSVVADLYGSALVDQPTQSTGKTAAKPMPAAAKEFVEEEKILNELSYLGNNRKHILLLVNYKDVKHIPDPELFLLTGILTACKLGLEDVVLLNRKNYPNEDYKTLNKQFRSRIVLLFDIPPESIGLPMSFPVFQQQSFNGVTYLYSQPLEEMKNDKVVKSKLWLCLKKIFNL